jgi:hypothetical protein
VSLIQQFYNEPRKFRILGDYTKRLIPPDLLDAIKRGFVDVQEGMKVIKINNDALNDITAGRYDVIIEGVPFSPSERQRQFYDLLNLRAAGVPIPDEALIKSWDGRGRMDILAGLEAQRQIMMAQAMAGKNPQSASPGKQASPGDLQFNSAGVQSPQAG